MNKCSIFFLPSIFLAFGTTATASPTELQHGLSRSEVITIMGPPIDKSERSIKSESVWEYKNLTLTFVDGLLARWNRSDGQDAAEKLPHGASAEATNRHPTQSLTFQELLKNIPDEGNAANQGTVGFPSQIQPMQIQPMMDSAPNTPPPGFPGGTNPGMSGLLEKLREQRGLQPQ